MHLLAPFILQNFKRILRADPELSECAIFGHKMAHLSRTIFFWHKPLLLLSSTCWPFSLCKIYKNFLQAIQICENAPFLGPKWSICPKQFFFVKVLILFSSNYQPLSLGKISEKSFQRIQSYEDVQFLGIKWPICPNENFFKKTS